MTLNEYQKETDKTAIYPRLQGLNYTALGLGNEAGEYQGVVKKIIRDGDKPDTEQKLVSELGDVLWYVSQCAVEIGCTLEHVAEVNLAKLKSRQERGVLKGSGDNR